VSDIHTQLDAVLRAYDVGATDHAATGAEVRRSGAENFNKRMLSNIPNHLEPGGGVGGLFRGFLEIFEICRIKMRFRPQKISQWS
jgi:hypothetical protein